MKINEPFHYDASPDAVVVMLADPEFQLRKCVESGALDQQVDVRPGAEPVITVERSMSTEQLDGIARKFVGPTIKIKETSEFDAPQDDGGRKAKLTLSFIGQPMTLHGSITLRPDGSGGCDGVLVGELKAGIPMVGGKVERAAAPGIKAGLRSEVRTGQAYLATRA